ncbi:MAG: hypothetical protein OXT09_22815 [Myxococcales bacterium]|nr:hypothetical protein [Myxococcales bacterium]
MRPSELSEIIRCLPKGKTPFMYYRDRYALLLLRYLAGSGRRIGELRRGRLGGLLKKPSLRPLLAGAADGVLRDELIDAHWPADTLFYTLSLSSWGEVDPESWDPTYEQTCQPGLNLVLQLNFSGAHLRRFRTLLPGVAPRRFNPGSHPARRRPNAVSLAWARLDVDLEGREALIEEVQSDWVRNVDHALACVGGKKVPGEMDGVALQRYRIDELEPHARLWPEAMLAAALWFLVDELGTRRIYYHTLESTYRMKELEPEAGPPRYLYASLPKRFLFERTTRPPALLSRCDLNSVRCKLHPGDLPWHVLDVGAG